MTQWLYDIATEQWQRKLIALISAIIIWVSVNNSITMTKTLVNVAVRVTNIPSDQTVVGLLPSGMLGKRVNLTLYGNRKILEDLEAGDVEVIVDASEKADQWIAQISKKNIVYAGTSQAFTGTITRVDATPLILKMSQLITAKVPVRITPPIGEPPEGYQYLNVWPRWLWHTISGPEEQVEELQSSGLQLTFDLADITKEELDQLESSSPDFATDEVNYLVPARWKRVAIPFHNYATEEINDPDTNKLRIEFLRKDLLPLNTLVPVQVFFPPQNSDTLNPDLFALVENRWVSKKDGITVLEMPLSIKNVSRLFADVVREYLQVVVIAQPDSDGVSLPYSIRIVNADALEDIYVSLLAPLAPLESDPAGPPQQQRSHLRERFRGYMRRFQLVKPNGDPLELQVELKGNSIVVQER